MNFTQTDEKFGCRKKYLFYILNINDDKLIEILKALDYDDLIYTIGGSAMVGKVHFYGSLQPN